MCPQFTELREKYISKYFRHLENCTLSELMNNNKEDITINVALYIEHALKRRQKLISELQKAGQTAITDYFTNE